MRCPRPEGACAAFASDIGAPISCGDRLGDLSQPRLIDGGDPLEERDPLFAGAPAEGLERAAGRGDRAIDVRRRAGADARDELLGRRIDDVQRFRLSGRRDPPSVDVELQVLGHNQSVYVELIREPEVGGPGIDPETGVFPATFAPR